MDEENKLNEEHNENMSFNNQEEFANNENPVSENQDNLTNEDNSLENQDNLTNENINLPSEEEKKPEEPKQKSNWYWIIYLSIAIIIIIIILLLLHGCNGIRNKNTNKVMETNEWITNMWNKCVDPIYWYTVDGTGVNGASIDIESVLSSCDTYYNEYKEKKESITSLGDEYNDFKSYYAKISEQIEIIYPKIKENRPLAQESVDYEENMETFYEYQVKLYNLIKEKYLKG